MLHLRYGGDVDVRHVLARVGDEPRRLRPPRRHRPGRRAQRRAGRRTRRTARRGVGQRARRARCSPSRPTAGCGCGRTASRAARRRWPRRSASAARARCGSCAARCTPPLPDPVWPDGVTPALVPARPRRRRVGRAQRRARSSTSPTRAAGPSTTCTLRMREPWFDPAGFLVADRGRAGRASGWSASTGPRCTAPTAPPRAHRTTRTRTTASRRTSTATTTATATSPIGEVYVVGVDPAQHGRGLGRALTLAGLQHLRSRGLPDAMLYVDADNTSAIAALREPRLHAAGTSTWSSAL